MFTLGTALGAADGIGSVGVITHPLDERGAPLLWARGVPVLPFDPCSTMIVRMIDLRQSLAGETPI
jgi:hypothetical protein